MIRIVLSTDAKGFSRNATVVASVLRRTREAVAVRVYTRGFFVPSFGCGRFSAEFIRTDAAATGSYPGHVPDAVFDRLRIIDEEREWDRVLVMDHDMLALCDLAPYFREDFEGNLLMGRLFGPGNTLGLQMKRRGGLPETLVHCEDHPYFYMGPMLNLAAMRREGTWERILEAHEMIGQDEQISLSAATGGRVKGVDKKWNLVPRWDTLDERSKKIPRIGEALQDGIRWVNGVPHGVIHWTGARKPWHRGTDVWRPDLWEAENATWEMLREGIWEKPLAIEVGADDGNITRGLLVRGWKVTMLPPRPLESWEPPELPPPFPDLEIVGNSATFVLAELVRMTPGAVLEEWNDKIAACDSIVLQGPRNFSDINAIKNAGYAAEARLKRSQWPTGGPHPSVLRFAPANSAGLSPNEDAYFSKRQSDDLPPFPSGYGMSEMPDTSALDPRLEQILKERLIGRHQGGPSILILGSARAAAHLPKLLPKSAICLIHQDPEVLMQLKTAEPGIGGHFLHAPVDPTLPFFDLSGICEERIDLLVISAGESGGPDLRRGASSVYGWLAPNALQLVLGPQGASLNESDQSNVEVIESGPDFSLLKHGSRTEAADQQQVGRISDLGSCAYLLAPDLAASERASLYATQRTGWLFKRLPKVMPEAGEIHWAEMRGMEAYGNIANLRGDYVREAVAAKRALLKALDDFLSGDASAALIIQEDCILARNAIELINLATSELPACWDLLYLHVSSHTGGLLAHTPHLARLVGARGSTAILWSRSGAVRLLDKLRHSDCEWEILLEVSQSDLNTFCALPMPARRRART